MAGKTKEIPEEIQKLLKQVVEHFDNEDRSVRERQIRTWRRLKLFWDGFQQTWYSEVAHDWRIWDNDAIADDTNQAYYDKTINVFRAYLESIIAALSVTVPPVKAFPDDADSVLDIETAKAGDKLAALIYRHNDVPLLWLHGLFTFMTEGMTACYCYPKADESYGTYEEKKYEDATEYAEITKCPICGFLLDTKELGEQEPQAPPPPPVPPIYAEQKDKFQPDDSDIFVQDYIHNSGLEECPNCMSQIAPELATESFTVTRLVGITQEPKSRICMEVYGGLYVKIANYAKKQSDTPYLMFMYETHYANVVERYNHLHGKDWNKKLKASMGPRDPYEEWARLSPQYQGEYPLNVITVRNCWLRPASFNILAEQDDIDKLKKLFPNGAKVVMANDEFAEACNEALDDCWTLTHNPLADFLNHDPLGLLLVSIQEITNDIISLTLQTMEHGIPQTFADPAVLNFDAYRQQETTPGGIYEAKPKSGQTMAQAFHEVKTATLSGEVLPFAQNIQNLAQLVSGAVPSIFGGQLEGSGTASEYSMSRAQALQRLQNTWKMLTIWWKNIFGKAIPMCIKEIKEDEHDVQRGRDGNFMNVFIRRAELQGKIGRVELEANENIPLTWSQRKDVIMMLVQAANPEILSIIGSPENLPIIREAIGLTDFFVPGEDDRNKQYDEIQLLLQSEPMPTGDMMNPEMPSVQPDPLMDNHAIEFEVCRKWAVSEVGRQTKMDNEAGYMNVMLHAKMHMMFMGPPQASEGEEGAAPSEKPNGDNKEAPITGESDVNAEV